MEISTEETGPGSIKIKYSGKLQIYSVKDFYNYIINLLEVNSIIEIDMSEVSDIDTAGVQSLYWLKKIANRENKKLKITNHSPSLLQLLDIYGLLGNFRDKVSITSSSRKNYKFKYGTKKPHISFRI